MLSGGFYHPMLQLECNTIELHTNHINRKCSSDFGDFTKQLDLIVEVCHHQQEVCTWWWISDSNAPTEKMMIL